MKTSDVWIRIDNFNGLLAGEGVAIYKFDAMGIKYLKRVRE